MEWERKMEAERLEREERMRRDEQRWERERLEETRRTEERERDRGRQHEQRLKEMEEQARRDREHQERMVQLTLQRSHNESPEGFIEKGAKLLAMFGMKPNDLVDRLTSTDAGPEAYAPIIEGVTSVLTTGMQALSDYAKTKATTDAARAAATQQAMVAAVAGPTVATAAIAGPAAPGTPAAPGAPAAPAAPAALRSNLPAHIQKAARDALIAVVRDLQRSTPDTWAKLFTDAITNTVAAYHYAKEVGLKPALREAGADDALTGAVGTQLQAQVAAFPLLADIPFGN
jgi:hypothetical protein